MKTIENSVRLIGNLGTDPEVITLESGKKVSNISIATNESYKNNKGELIDKAEWHKVVAWGKLAEITEKHLVKGKKVAIEGKLIHRKYEDKNGEPKAVSEVLASSILMLGEKKEKKGKK